jgi:hypothetical protein
MSELKSQIQIQMTLYKLRPPNPNRYPNFTNKLKPNSKSSGFDAKSKSFLRFGASLHLMKLKSTFSWPAAHALSNDVKKTRNKFFYLNFALRAPDIP